MYILGGMYASLFVYANKVILQKPVTDYLYEFAIRGVRLETLIFVRRIGRIPFKQILKTKLPIS
jgi:hypothetical protein